MAITNIGLLTFYISTDTPYVCTDFVGQYKKLSTYLHTNIHLTELQSEQALTRTLTFE